MKHLHTHKTRRGLRLQIIGCDAQAKGFVVQPRRWTLGRTFDWLNKCRLSKDYQHHIANSKAMARVTLIALMR